MVKGGNSKTPRPGLRKARQLARRNEHMSPSDAQRVLTLIKKGIENKARRNKQPMPKGLELQRKISEAAENIARVRRKRFGY